MINIIVAGACGRIGLKISRFLSESQVMKLAGAVERENHLNLGRDIGEILGIGKRDIILRDDLGAVIKSGEVVIDFTTPQATLKNLEFAAKNGKSIVIGTTGFKEEEIAIIKNFAKSIPCVFSPNMSVGANLIFKIAADIAEALGNDYDVEITEMHHRHKKDAPSGTAEKLAELIAKARGQNLSNIAIYGRKGITGDRARGSIGIHALRGGDIVGDHTVIYAGEAERIELTHRVQSRDAFARGALRAARFIASAKPGLYSMQDILQKKG